jgi:hypothetical protein
MSNKESQNPTNTSEKIKVNRKRRFILGAGALAPVVLTYISPPVLGAPGDPMQCPSQMLSGNTSRSVTPNCVEGNRPSFFSNPANISAWQNTGFTYGTIGSTQRNNSELENNHTTSSGCSNYSGGTTFKDAFGKGSTKPMRQILCSDPNSDESTYITALLNSKIKSNYFLKPQQVLDMYSGKLSIVDPINYLKNTWK